MKPRESIAIAAGTFLGLFLVYYFFAIPKPEGCGCEKRRLNVLSWIGIDK